MDDRTRSLLLTGTAALAILQFLHSLDVLRYTDNVRLSALFLKPDVVVGIGSCLAACALLYRRSPAARVWTIGGPTLVVVGFIQHHLLPTYSGGANPYYTFEDGLRGDFIRWITVLAIVGVGAWTAFTAWRSTRVRLVAA
jgi:hypothetical protein